MEWVPGGLTDWRRLKGNLQPLWSRKRETWSGETPTTAPPRATSSPAFPIVLPLDLCLWGPVAGRLQLTPWEAKGEGCECRLTLAKGERSEV